MVGRRGRAVWIVLAVLALGGGIAAALYVRGVSSKYAPAAPNRSLAPDSLAAYVEVRDAKTRWASVEKTESYMDFQASPTHDKLTGSPAVKNLLALAADVAKRTNFPLDQRNTMKLFGRELSFGIEPAASGPPRWILLSKLDVDALAKDLLKGDSDFTKLQDAIDEKTGKMAFALTNAEHRGWRISTAAKDGFTYHFTVLGDTLAASDALPLLQRAVDAHVDGGKGSLAQNDAFARDTSRVPADSFAVEWYDLGRLRQGRASVAAGLRALGAGDAAASALERILAGTETTPSFARGTALPEGDLYRLRWNYSVEAVPDTVPRPPLAAVLLPDAAVYLELRDPKGLVEAWDKSSLRSKLGAGPLGEKFNELLENPRAFVDEVESKLPIPGRRRKRAPGRGGAREGDADDASGVTDRNVTFETKMGLHAVGEAWTSLGHGTVAMAIRLPEEDEPDLDVPEFAVAGRADFGTQFVALAFEGFAMEDKKLAPAEYRGHTILTLPADDGPAASIVHAADHIVLASSEAVARQVVDGLTSAQPPAPSPRALALTDVPEHTKLSGWVDLQAVIAAIAARAGKSMTGPFESYRDASFSVQVAPDFSTAGMRTRVTLDASAVRYGGAVREKPFAWSNLPEPTIMHFGGFVDFARMWEMQTSALDERIGKTIREGEDAASRALEMDLRKVLLPALGPEISFAVVRSSANGSGQPPIPGVVFLLETKDQEIVRKAVDRGLALAQEASDKDHGKKRGRPPTLFKRDVHADTQITYLDFPDWPMPFHPGFAFLGDHFAVALDEATIRQMIDVGAGKAPAVAEAPYTKTLAAELPKGDGWAYLDWNRVLDQVAEYAPQMGGLAGDDDDAAMPEFPEDGDQEALAEWQRKFEAAQAEQQRKGGEKIRKWIDAARVVEYMGSTSRWTEDGQEGSLLVRFAK